MKIRIARIDPERPYEEYRCLEERIPGERRARIQRFRFEPDKIRSLAAGVLLQEEISAYLAGKTAALTADQNTASPADNNPMTPADENGYVYTLKEGEHGKPYLAGAADFYFSISHAGEFVALITDDQPIGIDVEKVQIRESLARRFYSKQEREEIRVMQEADAKQGVGNRAAIAFTKIWTGKEAYLKYTGSGITNALAEIGVLDPAFWRANQIYFSGTLIADGAYYVTVCSGKQIPISDQIVLEEIRVLS